MNGRRFLWWVRDEHGREGFWALELISEDRRFHFVYPLIQQTLSSVAEDPQDPPLPSGFHTTGTATVTPRFVRELILWLLEHHPEFDAGDFNHCCIWPPM